MRYGSLAATVLAAVLTLGCQDATGTREQPGTGPGTPSTPGDPPPQPRPQVMIQASGNGQIVPAGAKLPLPLAVRLYGGASDPFAGARVDWAVTAPAGARGTLAAASSTTDSTGTATIGLTVGAPGRYVVTASVDALKETFVAIAFGPVARVDPVSSFALLGPGDRGSIGASAYDALGTPVLGARFTFRSSDTTVATVDSTGAVLARRAGSALVTVSSGAASAPDTVRVGDTSRLRPWSVSLGPAQGCALAGDSTAYCWRNAAGAPVPGDHHFASLSVGDSAVCALDAQGAAWCWGRNTRGELGNGTLGSSDVPGLVSGGLRFTSLSVGRFRACGVAEGGAAYCWGSGAGGSLGTGSTADAPVPTRVAGGLAFTTVQTHAEITCGLTTARRAYCWGLSQLEALGRDSSVSHVFQADSSLVPIPVTGAHTFDLLTVGRDLVCAAATGEDAYCWGVVRFSTHAGPAEWTSIPRPVPGTTGMTMLQAGDGDVCGVRSGALFCWSDNYFAQLGDGTRYTRDTPVRSQASMTFTSVAVGQWAVCAADPDGKVWCWGSGPLGTQGGFGYCSDGRDMPGAYCRWDPLPVVIEPRRSLSR